MTDHTHDDPWERQIDAQEARLRLTYDLDAFVAAVEAEPHRAHELLDREALPSRWEEAQATLIAKGLIDDPERDIWPAQFDRSEIAAPC